MTRRSPTPSVPLPVLPLFLAIGWVVFSASVVQAQSLRGSAASLDRQNHQARAHDFTVLRTAQQVRDFVAAGYLVPVVPNADFDVHQVSFPYARPEVRVFIERLASQYRAACGEKLVVTSLTRPLSNQPPNASSRSVHPTGMALDLRRSANVHCRQWLESTLLSLESQGVLEAIYERNPPHYHVAVFPRPYEAYLAQRTGDPTIMARAVESTPEMQARWITHTVNRGETLTAIAGRYGVAVGRIRSENGIRGDRILVGQSLRVPVYETSPSGSGTVVASRASSTPPASQGGDNATGASSAAAVSHTIARGESLWTISRRYGVTEDALRAANGIQGSRILIGERLTVPPAEGWNGVLQHTVRGGESLWTIATRHGTTVDEIRRRNGMDTTRIYAGQVLDVPLSF